VKYWPYLIVLICSLNIFAQDFRENVSQLETIIQDKKDAGEFETDSLLKEMAFNLTFSLNQSATSPVQIIESNYLASLTHYTFWDESEYPWGEIIKADELIKKTVELLEHESFVVEFKLQKDIYHLRTVLAIRTTERLNSIVYIKRYIDALLLFKQQSGSSFDQSVLDDLNLMISFIIDIGLGNHLESEVVDLISEIFVKLKDLYGESFDSFNHLCQDITNQLKKHQMRNEIEVVSIELEKFEQSYYTPERMNQFSAFFEEYLEDIFNDRKEMNGNYEFGQFWIHYFKFKNINTEDIRDQIEMIIYKQAMRLMGQHNFLAYFNNDEYDFYKCESILQSVYEYYQVFKFEDLLDPIAEQYKEIAQAYVSESKVEFENLISNSETTQEQLLINFQEYNRRINWVSNSNDFTLENFGGEDIIIKMAKERFELSKVFIDTNMHKTTSAFRDLEKITTHFGQDLEYVQEQKNLLFGLLTAQLEEIEDLLDHDNYRFDDSKQLMIMRRKGDTLANFLIEQNQVDRGFSLILRLHQLILEKASPDINVFDMQESFISYITFLTKAQLTDELDQAKIDYNIFQDEYKGQLDSYPD